MVALHLRAGCQVCARARVRAEEAGRGRDLVKCRDLQRVRARGPADGGNAELGVGACHGARAPASAGGRKRMATQGGVSEPSDQAFMSDQRRAMRPKIQSPMAEMMPTAAKGIHTKYWGV